MGIWGWWERDPPTIKYLPLEGGGLNYTLNMPWDSFCVSRTPGHCPLSRVIISMGNLAVLFPRKKEEENPCFPHPSLKCPPLDSDVNKMKGNRRLRQLVWSKGLCLPNPEPQVQFPILPSAFILGQVPCLGLTSHVCEMKGS